MLHFGQDGPVFAVLFLEDIVEQVIRVGVGQNGALGVVGKTVTRFADTERVDDLGEVAQGNGVIDHANQFPAGVNKRHAIIDHHGFGRFRVIGRRPLWLTGSDDGGIPFGGSQLWVGVVVAALYKLEFIAALVEKRGIAVAAAKLARFEGHGNAQQQGEALAFLTDALQQLCFAVQGDDFLRIGPGPGGNCVEPGVQGLGHPGARLLAELNALVLARLFIAHEVGDQVRRQRQRRQEQRAVQ